MYKVLKGYYDHSQSLQWINKSVAVPLVRDMGLGSDALKYLTPMKKYIAANTLMHWENMSLTTTVRSSGRVTIPEIFVINLDYRVDRWCEWNFHWRHYQRMLKFERVSGLKHNQGWIGCALSQLKCVEMAKQRGLPFCIIMEDDCAPLYQNFEGLFIATLNWLSNNLSKWDIWNGLPGNPIDNVPLEHIEGNMYSSNGGVNHHLIVINSTMYDKLLSLRPFYLEPDPDRSVLCIDEITNRHFKVVTTYPFLVSTYSECSDIDEHAVVNAYDKMGELETQSIRSYDFSDITICITSADRATNLKRTLHSIQPLIDHGAKLLISSHGSHLENLKSLYSNEITTPFVLHCEDDWTFTSDAPDCLMVARALLRAHACGQVWLRDINDLMGHPVYYYNAQGIHTYRPIAGYGSGGIYNGFTLNPSLLLTETMVNKISELPEGLGLDLDSVSLEIELNRGWAGTLCLPRGCVWHNGAVSTKNKTYLRVLEIFKGDKDI